MCHVVLFFVRNDEEFMFMKKSLDSPNHSQKTGFLKHVKKHWLN